MNCTCHNELQLLLLINLTVSMRDFGVLNNARFYNSSIDHVC